MFLGDERTQSQTFIQLAHQQQTTVGGDARTLEINIQRRIKRELKWLILFLTTGSSLRRVRFALKTVRTLALRRSCSHLLRVQEGNVG